MKKESGIKTKSAGTFSILLLLIASWLFNMLMPQYCFSYAVLGIALLFALQELKKEKTKL